MQDISVFVELIQNAQGRVTIPPGDYVISSNAPAPYALLPGQKPSFGPCGVYLNGLHDIVIDAYGVNIHCADGANGCNWLHFNDCWRLQLSGLTFVPNENGSSGPGYGDYIIMVGMRDCVFRDIYMPGPFEHEAFGGLWWERVTFDRIVMYGAFEGFDCAYVRNCVWRDCHATGRASDAVASPSPWFGWINIADDPNTLAAYGDSIRPVWWQGDDDTRDITVDNCTQNGFGKGLVCWH